VKKSLNILLLIVSILLTITGCNKSAIGVASNYKQGNFIVGKTTKMEIIDHLGLPQNVERDKQGFEHLLYLGGEQHLGRCEYCTHAVGSSFVPAIKDKVADHNGAEYIIDKKGVLMKKLESSRQKQ